MSKKKKINRDKLKNSRFFPNEYIDSYEKDYLDIVEELEIENKKKQSKIKSLVHTLEIKGINTSFLINLIISPIALRNDYKNNT